MDAHVHAAVVAEPLHAANDTVPQLRLRKTGVVQRETCSCGATRRVWITTFKVDAGAWCAPELSQTSEVNYMGPRAT